MLDPGSPLPLYQQLKIALRRSLEAGVWAADQAIPTERELTAQYGVSRITVRQALADLVAEGLLYRRHGKGTFVAPGAVQPISETLSDLTGHLEELLRRGLDPEIEVLSLTKQPLPNEVAAALGRPEGAEGWFLHRRTRLEGAPLMLAEVWLPADLGISLDAEYVQRYGFNHILTEHGHPLVRGWQRIAAQTARTEEARLLAIKRGEALLRVVRVIYGVDDRPLVWFRTLYRADRYEYEVELKRRR
ncbi:MAG: GntR family transcriptional regulator [Firmicutes bacterium]|nr:GntR family transcriptional regulator [Bacillota bacterium]